MGDIDWASLGLGGGIFSAIAIVLVTLIKARSSDRTSILAQQASHMDRLGKERNEAVTARDDAYADANEWRGKYEIEIRLRIEAQATAATAAATTAALNKQIEVLTQEVVQLQQQVAALRLLSTDARGGTS